MWIRKDNNEDVNKWIELEPILDRSDVTHLKTASGGR